MAKVYQMPAKPQRQRPSWRPRRLIAIIVAAVVVAIAVFVLFLNAYTDWLWFGEAHLRVVFWTQIWSRIVVGAASGDWSCLDEYLIRYVVEPAMRPTVLASSLAATLELVREGKVELHQQSAFAPIFLRKRDETGEPSGDGAGSSTTQ